MSWVLKPAQVFGPIRKWPCFPQSAGPFAEGNSGSYLGAQDRAGYRGERGEDGLSEAHGAGLLSMIGW